MHAYFILIKGVVQSVGFRPFIYRLFSKDSGWVKNTTEGVVIYLETNKDIELVKKLIIDNKPKNAQINSIDIKNKNIKSNAYKKFFIKESLLNSSTKSVDIPADLGICDDCLKEMFDKHNRRFLYPFINCTNCGPRFSIIKKIPYDRKNTTMDKFSMCPECDKEYKNPLSRRFHAETICCSKSSIEYTLIKNGKIISKNIEAIKTVAHELQKGRVGLIKGIGGYHIVANAHDEKAVNRVKLIKSREEKPFAVIAKDMDVLMKHCLISAKERKLLESQIKPIVLLRLKDDILKSARNDSPYLGVMLPYAPIHHLLFYFSNLEFIIATSANLSEMPLIYKDKDALNFEGVDFVLANNRDIVRPLEDSVTQCLGKNTVIYRYARGCAPSPFYLNGIKENVLALGADLKNNICISKHNSVVLSQFTGDLRHLDNFLVFKQKVDDFKSFFNIKFDKVMCDKHPQYISRAYAHDNFNNVVEVQHHKAHFASVLLEHQYKDSAIGVIMDGTGYGDDGKIWGGEFFVRDKAHIERVGHIKYMPLLFGDKSIKEPYRIALVYLCYIYKDCSVVEKMFSGYSEILTVIQKIMKDAVYTSSAGRLFDAVSAILNIVKKNTFDAESSIKLQWSAMNYNNDTILPYHIDGYDIDFSETVAYIAENRNDLSLSKSFHNTFIDALYNNVKNISKTTGVKTVAMSGGVFQNEIVLNGLRNKLIDEGFKVIFNRRFPINDGNIALGQLFFS